MENIQSYEDFIKEGVLSKTLGVLVLSFLMNINNAFSGGGGGGASAATAAAVAAAVSAATSRAINSASKDAVGFDRFPEERLPYKNIRDININDNSLKKAMTDISELITNIQERWGYNKITKDFEALKYKIERLSKNPNDKDLRSVISEFRGVLKKYNQLDPLFDRALKHMEDQDVEQLTRDYYMLYDNIYNFDNKLYQIAKDAGEKVGDEILWFYTKLLIGTLILAGVVIILTSYFD